MLLTRIITIAAACAASAIAAHPSTTHAQAPNARAVPQGSKVGIIFKYDAGEAGDARGGVPELAAQAATEAEATLRRAGYEVVSRAEVVTQLSGTDVRCGRGGTQDCEPDEIMSALGLDAVVLVALWNGDDLTVEVTTPDAIGRARVKLWGKAGAAAAVVTEALADVRNGLPVEVRVDAFPTGAEVLVDGQVVDVAPATTRLRPGAHKVTLRKLSYTTTTRDIEVPRGHQGTFVVRISMEPASGRTAAEGELVNATAASDATPTWDYLVAGALIALSVPLIVSPLSTLADDGDCDGGITRKGGCERHSFGAGSVLELLGGAAALGASIYFIAATPISASLATDGEQVHVQLHTTF